MLMARFCPAQEDIGKCGPECKTVQRAAEDIVGDHDTDIAEKLWQVLLPRQHSPHCYHTAICCRSVLEFPLAGFGLGDRGLEPGMSCTPLHPSSLFWLKSPQSKKHAALMLRVSARLRCPLQRWANLCIYPNA